ncbi:hypothetical protein TIFTF001_043052 [Ficus carica]|uniref:Uncharacterized protein n=1 Tax=Ficus carica TaxID=3494 RepID=A0AA88CJT1_FICCA|nr:hypothetical protein TIFTF001_043052 [Ficus carica]
MNLVPNPGLIEEDRKASLAFWGMEPRIIDGTQGAAALAKWLHAMLQLGAFMRMSLWAITASGSELHSENVVDKLSLRYDMKRSR